MVEPAPATSSSTKGAAAPETAEEASPAALSPVKASRKKLLPVKVEEAVDVLKITFHIWYNTKMGQSLYVVGNHELLGNNDVHRAFPLKYHNHESWQGVLEIPRAKVPDAISPISIYYAMRMEQIRLSGATTRCSILPVHLIWSS